MVNQLRRKRVCYHLDNSPSVARSKGESPMVSRIMVASNKPFVCFWYVASWQQAPIMRTRQRTRVKIQPEERVKP